MYSRAALPQTGVAGSTVAGGLLLSANHVLSALVVTFALMALWTIVGEVKARRAAKRAS